MFLFRLQKHVVFEDILFSNISAKQSKQQSLIRLTFIRHNLNIGHKTQFPLLDTGTFFIREAFVNAIIHSDYQMDAGVLKVIKKDNGFTFTNPGVLKLPKEEIYKGGNSKARNPKMQTMLRMIGFGDNAGSGFPLILNTWKANGWITPELEENSALNQVTLSLVFDKSSEENKRRKQAK